MSEELDLAGRVAGDVLNDPSTREFLARLTGATAVVLLSQMDRQPTAAA